MQSVDLVKYKNGLNNHVKRNNLILKIVEKITNIPKFQELTQPNIHSELILLVCSIIENTVIKKDKIDKKQLCIDIFTELGFIKNESDKEHVKNIIEFLHSNKHIKKIKTYKKAYIYIKDWFYRKFL